jgi:TonB-dependent starch-binding outer membrane protein SusC
MTDFISGKAAIAGWKPRQGELKWDLTKTLRIMKLAAIFLFAAAMHVSAKGVTQDKISLSLKNAPLEKAFGEIEAQSGFVFIYKDETVKDKRISIQISNVSLSQALDECLKGQALSYQIVGKSVAIKAIRKNTDQIGGEPTGTPPFIDVRGRVVNEKGEPVEGVTVIVVGGSKKTVTDKNGEFSIATVELNAILLFTHIGMEPFEVKVSGKSELAISLRTKVSALGDVVVTVSTGYQDIPKERVTGSFSKLDSASYHRRAGMSIIERLDGTVPGLIFDKKEGNKIQVRGISTLEGIPGSSSSPLIIVDNFPYTGNLNLINPNDIADITVLKDAAAASIWGTLAGNGVIVITTKKGKFNQPLRVSASSNVTVTEKPDLYYLPRMEMSDFISVEQFLFGKGYYNSSISNTLNFPVLSPVVEVLAKRRAGKISAEDSVEQISTLMGYDLRKDLDEYVYQPQVNQQHYISLSGGNNLMSYTFSAGYNNERPNIQGSKTNQQYTINALNVFRPVKNLEIEAGINYSNTINKTPNFSLPNLYPYAKLADENGEALSVPNTFRSGYIDTIGGGRLLDWHYRPLDEIRLSDNSTTTRLLRLNFKGSYKITSWLKAEVYYQNLQQNGNSRNYFSQLTYFARNEINRFTQLSGGTVTRRVPLGGILNMGNTSLNTTNWRGQISTNKRWNSKHELNALVAGEVSQSKLGSNSYRYYGYNDNLSTFVSGLDYVTSFPTLPSGTDRIRQEAAINDQGQVNNMVSLIGNASYTYNSLYTIYGSARRDGANIFGVNTNNKWKPLWSVGAGWNVSNEKFYSVQWLPYLRIRASLGHTGNVNNQFSGLSTILYSTTTAQFTNLIYASVGNPPNPDLRWEQVKIFNAGVDFSLFKNRLTGSFDAFSKKSTDVISPFPFDPTTGVDQYIINTASLKGSGFELTLNSKNNIGAFTWETRFGLSYAKTIVTEVYNGKVKAGDFIAYGLNQSKGRVAFGVASYRWAGLDPANGDPQGYLNKEVSKNYTAIFSDSVENQVFHGSGIPLYSGYLNNAITWKGITLSANITYRFAYYFRKPTINYNSLFNNWESHADYTLRWQKPGDEEFTNVPSLVYPANSNRDLFYQYSEVNVLRADNIKLQDLRLSYTISKNQLKLFGLQNAQVFFYANNLNVILWRANKSNLDPDFTGGKNASLAPTPKTWTGGITLGF